MTDTASNTTPPSHVWIVHRSRYEYNDNYYIWAEAPHTFYLSEDEAKLTAGYCNLQTLAEYGHISPPEGSELAIEFDDIDFEDVATDNDYATKLASMPLNEACMFVADKQNFEKVQRADSDSLTFYRVVKLSINKAT